MCEPGNKNDEQVAVRHADASGGYIIENQHDEKRMRGIRVNKRISGETSEEQLDEWRKTERFQHEAPNTSASSDPCVAQEYPVSCEIQSRPGSVLVRKSGRVDDDMRITALDAFYEMDGRKSRYIGEVLDRHRGEDAGDLKRIELVEKLTYLNVLEKEIFKKDPKILTEERSWRTWKSNQNTVMDEEVVQNTVMDEEVVQNIVMDEEMVQNVVMDEKLVQNVVMDEKIVKNFVMGAKIDPNVEMF